MINQSSGFGCGGHYASILSYFDPHTDFTKSLLDDTVTKDLDSYFMSQALEMAHSKGFIAAPNPSVGCIIVGKTGKILARGVTQQWGHAHAETHAFSQVNPQDLKGATVYVTLEPCTHFGKQAPCINHFKDKGIARVVIATRDPNPKVNGQGIHMLKDWGIAVTEHVMEHQARIINMPFFHECAHKSPFIALKWAQSLDGALADDYGTSKWISSKLSRHYTHWLRQKYDCIMVGIDTLLRDNPSLDIRDMYLPSVNVRNPLKLVFDPNGKIFNCSDDQSAALLKKALNKKFPVCVFIKKDVLNTCVSQRSCVRDFLLSQSHIEFISIDKAQKSTIHSLITVLSSGILNNILGRPTQSIMIEGGPKLIGQFIYHNLFHAAHVFVAPFFMGKSTHKINCSENHDDVHSKASQPNRLHDIARMDVLSSWQFDCDFLYELSR